ncbi:MAG: ribbon-helix-helix domain-containing protein [Candidatus Woesearchaeota archaeon]
MNQLIHIRLEQSLNSQIENVVKTQFFTNKTEFIKDAIRKSLEEYRLQESILRNIQGSSKGCIPTREQRKMYLKKFEKKLTTTQANK